MSHLMKSTATSLPRLCSLMDSFLDAKQNIVVHPEHFWETTLRPRIDAAVQRKLPGNDFTPDEANIAVCINDRAEEDLEISFPDCTIEWDSIGQRLLKWSNLFQAGKRLKIKIDFTYTEVESRREQNRRQGVRSQRRELAEQEERDRLEGRNQEWKRVINLFACPQVGCNIGPWCWRNPESGKRFRVDKYHMQQLKDFNETGGKLETHEDVPAHIREAIMESSLTSGKKRSASAIELPPITIQNMPTIEPPHKRLRIHGGRDATIRQYRDWLCEEIEDETWKDEIHLASRVSFENRLELAQLDENQDEEIKFLCSKQIPRGTACLWVKNIGTWFEETHNAERGV